MIKVGTFLLLNLSFLLVIFAQTRHDLFIHVDDTDSLDASYYVPPASPPSSGYPAILFVHGFGGSKYSVIASCSLYSASGYLTLCYSVRGHGISSGLSTIMSIRERRDLAEVVDYLKSLPNVDSTAMGISGGSQGGLHGLWAAADQLSVKAVTADVIVPQWASDMLMNGCVRRTLLLLLKNSTVRYSAERDTLWNLVQQDGFDSLKIRFTRNRDVDTARLHASQVPINRFLKWQDHYFTATDGIASFLRHNAIKKLYLGTRGHFSDQVESERFYHNDQVTRWFKEFLKNQITGILNEPLITYAYSSLPMDTAGFFTWARVGVNSWPPEGVHPVQLYLADDSTLSYTPPLAFDDSLILLNEYLDSTYTFDKGYSDSFRGSRFDAALPKTTFTFTSPPLPDNIFWVGVPKMKLFAQSEYEKFPLHVQIYEEDSLGNKFFINRIDFTAHHWIPSSDSVIDVEGIPHAHKFTRGSRIRIEVTNIDETNRLLYGTYPFVVPLFAQVSATIYFGASYPSYIELPLIGSPTSVEMTSPIVPVVTTLLQNYPNPFNPKTTITYFLPYEGFITLKVYDVLGREIKTLVNVEQQPGLFHVGFDGSELSSGIYFYRLQTESSQKVKKMLLLR